jgi:ribosomal protein S18 acetylase RimI-like enzyme
LITSFEGFSSFAAKPLLNLHDVAVLPDYRGLGIAQALLSCAESYARSIGCCKLTLEVLQGNAVAQKAYLRFGFAAYTLLEEQGAAMFWQKKLEDH